MSTNILDTVFYVYAKRGYLVVGESNMIQKTWVIFGFRSWSKTSVRPNSIKNWVLKYVNRLNKKISNVDNHNGFSYSIFFLMLSIIKMYRRYT